MSHTHVEKKEGHVKVEKGAAATVKPHVPPEHKAKEIQRHDKTNLVEVVEGLKHGELPSNAQIHKELGDTREFVEHRQKHATTKDEQEAMKDMKDLLAVTQLTLEEKNCDNLLQHFLSDLSALMEKPSLGLNDPKKLQKDVGNIMSYLKTIITALMKSQNFRNCVIDLIKIVREILNYNTRQTQAGSKLQQSFTTTGVSTKETAKKVAIDAKDTMLNMRAGDIPQKHRDAIMAHLQMLIREINQYPESREAFQKLISLWSMANEETYKHWDIASTDPDFTKVYNEGIKIIEAYTGGRSIHEFLLRFRKVVNIISQDPEIRDFFNDFRDYLTSVISKPELLDNQAFIDRGYALIKRGRILAKRYREDVIINSWLDEGYEIAMAMKNDTRANQIVEHAKKVANDFTYTDKHGRRHFNTDLLEVIRTEIIPFLISRIKEVPVPGFEVQSEDFERLVVDDIFITIDDILPDMIKFHSESKTEVGLASDQNPLAHKTFAKFHVEGIRPSVKDFYFSFKKKKVITITDEGRADLRIIGSGLNITITFKVKSDKASGRALLAVADVEVVVDRIDLDILEAKHKVLLNIATSLFKNKLKVAVENAIKGKIQEYATDLIGTINKKVITNVSMSKIGDTVKSTIKEKILA